MDSIGELVRGAQGLYAWPFVFLIRFVVLKARTISFFASVMGEVCSKSVASTTLGSKSSPVSVGLRGCFNPLRLPPYVWRGGGTPMFEPFRF